jgi:hypothetical protein
MKRRLAAFVLTVAISGIVLSACSSGPSSLGQQACAEVAKSITLYNQSLQQTSPAATAQLLAQATADLRLALPLAAAAASTDPTWQPLEATLSETNRFSKANGSPNEGDLNEGFLTTALTAQCSLTPSG